MRLRPKKERDMAHSVIALATILGRLGITCLTDKYTPVPARVTTRVTPRQFNAYVGFTVSRAYQYTDKYLGKYDDYDDTY